MNEVVVKVIAEVGFFWLAANQQHFPHRRAVWGIRIFVRGPSQTNWNSELLKFRDFIRFSHNYWCQISLFKYYKKDMPLENKREAEQQWGSPVVLWDSQRAIWPNTGGNPNHPYTAWSGTAHRGSGYNYYPLPPSVSYRYPRLPLLNGRKQYGYLRCVEYRHVGCLTRFQGERLPFFVHPSRLPDIHQSQIMTPLQMSGLTLWHQQGNPVREVMLSYRKGSLSIIPVTGYSLGTVTSTARNFSLPVV